MLCGSSYTQHRGIDLSENRKIYTVSRLNQEVQSLLESRFGTLWLEGELSNFSRPGSGHFYFTLKDSRSQVRCAMFKGRNRYLDFEPGNGDKVLVRGKLGLYAARGDFQLIVEHMEPAGAGILQAAFEKTKQELQEKGWFDVDKKLELPGIPRTIGVVTSPTSAALQDVLQVLGRRYRQAPIIVYPTATQGAQAAPAIVAAIEKAGERQETDVLLLVRGGGSLEDLWAFNEVTVAQSIRNCKIPIVTGIGHEIDFTISDLVADQRAPTPSAAAELATPDNTNMLTQVERLSAQLQRVQSQLTAALKQRLQQQITRLQLRHPQRMLQDQSQRTDELQLRLQQSWMRQISRDGERTKALTLRLQNASPAAQLPRQRAAWQALIQRLGKGMVKRQDRARADLNVLTRSLSNVSPLAVLDRGYAIIKKGGELIRDYSDVSPGDNVIAQLANGEIHASVTTTQSTKPLVTTDNKSSKSKHKPNTEV